MKSITKYIIMTIGIVCISCSSDEGPAAPSARDEFIDKIAATWTASGDSQILLDELDVTTLLDDFEITINKDLTYTTNSNMVDVETLPWPTAGSFIVNEALNQLTRNDGLMIKTSVNANNQLIMEFQFTDEFEDSKGGRMHSITGSWVMQLGQM